MRIIDKRSVIYTIFIVAKQMDPCLEAPHTRVETLALPSP
jgi:hypothetical protein